MTKILSILIIGLTAVLTISCSKGTDEVNPTQEELSTAVSKYTAGILNDYAGLQLELIKATPGYEGPVAARSMAYLALAAYETAVSGMPTNQSLKASIEGLDNLPEIDKSLEYNWPLAINSSQHTLMKNLYGTTSDVYKTKMDTLKKKYEQIYKVGVGSDAVERSIRYGAEVAQVIWTLSQKDGGHKAYDNNYPLSNSVFNSAASWKPTGEKTRPLLPKWGEVKTFTSANKSLKAAAPEPFSFKEHSTFFDEAYEVYLTSSNLNDAQKEIMNFWEMPPSSVTQAGNQLALVSNLITKENYKLDQALKLYLKVTFAMHESYISSWKSKFSNNLMRPVTYINQAIDPHWVARQIENAVPDYTSEQAAVVSAVATILANEFGEVYTFEITSQHNKALKRAYKNFTNYAKEAEVSPVYAGIHYRMSVKNGASTGKEIANNVLKLDLKAPISDSTTVSIMRY